MLLVFTDEHKEHLSFLTTLDSEVINEFCKIGVEFMKKGTNPKIYTTAAQKMDVEVDTVRHGVEGLMYLLSESSKHMLNDIDFQDSIMTLGFSEDLTKHLLALYKQNRSEIRNILAEMSMDLPHYHDLEWRLDVQLASRSSRHQVNPTILMKLHTIDDGKLETHLLQTDPTNLVHLTEKLAGALEEIKSAHCRRILRNI